MKTSEILKKARALISDPSRWCTRYLAEDEAGLSCDVETGVRFCALGAIDKVCGGVDHSEQAERLLREWVASSGRFAIGTWNDLSSHAEVLAGFDSAISLAEARGQ